MRFEARELKPHAEPVSGSELKEGSIYFSVQYVDNDMMVPAIEPLVFVGENLCDGDVARLYFQDASSYEEGLRFESATPDERGNLFYAQSESYIKHIFPFERALDELLRCSLRRSAS